MESEEASQKQSSHNESNQDRMPEIPGADQSENNHAGAKSGRTDRVQSRTGSRKSVSVRSMKGKRTLKDAKRDRQQVEKDAELLANRIALLKQEEMRTWKKIDETRKRAKDVLDMKKKNEERIKKKMFDERNKNKNMKKNQLRVRMLREMRNKEKNKIREAIYMSKKSDAKMTKNEEKRNMRIKSEMMRRNWMIKRDQSKQVKDQLQAAERKKKDNELKKIEEAKREFDQRITQEIRKTKQKEKEVMQMEMIEMELIKKLQNTQNIQKNAYKELENALAQPSVFLQNKGNRVPQNDTDRSEQ
jgi:hypothetical protein